MYDMERYGALLLLTHTHTHTQTLTHSHTHVDKRDRRQRDGGEGWGKRLTGRREGGEAIESRGHSSLI